MKNLIERIEARLDDWGAKLEKKNIEYPVDLICGILFLVIGIVLIALVLWFPKGILGTIRERWLPWLM